MRKILSLLKNIFLLIIVILCLFAALELLFRGYHRIFKGIPFMRNVLYSDEKLGWRGKQIFGNAKTDKYKIFIVGDSFTDGFGLKEEDMYYNVIGRKMNAELFIYGGVAYGTLQEYLVIDKFFDEIKPDLVLLQVYYNDFINNSWELEGKSLFYNSNRIKPFLVDGNITYYFPAPFKNMRLLLVSYSRFLSSLSCRINYLWAILAKKGIFYNVERRIGNDPDFEDFQASVIVTEEIVRKIKQRIGETPLVAFAIDDRTPYYGHFKRIFTENKIGFIQDVPTALRQKQKEGFSVMLKDKIHLNKTGSLVCGELVAEKLIKMGYGKSKRL
jgi:lysophospholipase L1-like esterase